MKERLLFLFCFSFISPLLLLAGTNDITLKEAVTLAMKHDIELTRLRYDKESFNAEYEQARKNYLPELTVEVSKSNSASILTNPRGVTVFSFYASANQTLYDRGLNYSLKKAKSQKKNNNLNIQKRLNDLHKEIISLYYSVLNLKEVADIKGTEYRKAQLDYKVEEDKLKLKGSLPYDVMVAKGYTLKTRNEWQDNINAYDREYTKLKRKLNLNHDLELIDPGIRKIKVPSLKEAVNLALYYRPDINAKYLEHKMKREEYEIERSVHYPKIELFADYRQSERSGADTQEDWSVFFLLSMAIGDDVKASGKGGLKKYSYLDDPTDEESIELKAFDKDDIRVRKAKRRSDYKTVEAEIKDLKITIEQDVMEAYHALEKEINNYELASFNRKLGEAGVQKTNAEVAKRVKELKDLIDMKKQKTQYDIEYEQSILNVRLAFLNLKWAMGVLWLTENKEVILSQYKKRLKEER